MAMKFFAGIGTRAFYRLLIVWKFIRYGLVVAWIEVRAWLRKSRVRTKFRAGAISAWCGLQLTKAWNRIRGRA